MPKWLVSKEYGLWVLAAYGLVFMIILPTVVVRIVWHYTAIKKSFGIVFIESLSLGRPVLVSKKFGALEYVTKGKEKLDLLTFDPNDPEELGSKILDFERRNDLGDSFYEDLYIQNFDKDIIYKKFLFMSKNLIHQRKKL